MGTRVDRAAQLVSQLQTAGVKATGDAAAAQNNRPCVLVAPPAIDWQAGTYAGPMLTWRLVCLAGHDNADLAAFQQIDDLVDQVEAAGLPVELAEPAAYQLTPSTGTVPAYIIRITE